MTYFKNEINIGSDFGGMFKLVSEKLYSNQKVFLRENVQNAIDAIRELPLYNRSSDSSTCVKIRTNEDFIEIEDNGIGMSLEHMANYFWVLGKSSKNNAESKKYGVIGQFGIGAFANFGVCKSLEVHTYRKYCNQIKSRVLKKDLEIGKTLCTIENSNKKNTYGTIIIGELIERNLKDSELKKYLGNHIRFIPEKVYYNDELISNQEFPTLNIEEWQNIFECKLDLEAFKLNIRYLKKVNEIAILINSIDIKIIFDGLLKPESKTLEIFQNRFLIIENYKKWDSIQFAGYINSNIIIPNATREGIDSNSEDILDDFLVRLTSMTLDVLSKSDLLFFQYEVINYLSRRSLTSIEKYLEKYLVRVHGKKERLSLKNILDEYLKFKNKVLISEVEDLPPHVISTKDQGVLAIMLGDIPSGIKDQIIRYLKQKVSAIPISEFELNAVPLKETEITKNMLDIKEVLHEIIEQNWYIKNFEIILCRLSLPKNSISIIELQNKIQILLNVNSEIFKKLEEFINSPHLKAIINNLLVQKYLGDVLVKFLPSDLGIALANFTPKHHLLRIEEVTELELVRGSSNWIGPTENCIHIKSVDFKELEGYYIKLPNRITNRLNTLLGIARAPDFVWIVQEVTAIFRTGRDEFFVLEILADDRIEYKGLYSGSIKNEQKILIYKTGTFIPIPFPQLKMLLPLNTPKDLKFGYRAFGIKVDISDS